ncbi:MAG: TetR family transcriptional regulator [Burkholderiaceae bacterium]|nr:TetR family transcriptional regulator [Burkholderiaceae bacterium]MDO9089178.1 TetR family transcriptional regulator [Burkholderiaceae bacterium]
MARPRSASHEIRRDAILDVAAQCFAERSYPAASMQDIATACGTSKALLHDTRFLGEQQREQIPDRQRDVVSAVTRFLRRAYPERLDASNQTATAMMLFGMINWTFTGLRPGGPMSYEDFAREVIAMLEHGLGGVGAADN